MDSKALVGQLEDGRIIKLEDTTFTELIDGKWVEPEKDFTAIEFMDSVDLSDSDIREMLKLYNKTGKMPRKRRSKKYVAEHKYGQLSVTEIDEDLYYFV